MFTINQRVVHVDSKMVGTVIAQRINMERGIEEIRVLFDEHDKVSSWDVAASFLPA